MMILLVIIIWTIILLTRRFSNYMYHILYTTKDGIGQKWQQVRSMQLVLCQASPQVTQYSIVFMTAELHQKHLDCFFNLSSSVIITYNPSDYMFILDISISLLDLMMCFLLIYNQFQKVQFQKTIEDQSYQQLVCLYKKILMLPSCNG